MAAMEGNAGASSAGRAGRTRLRARGAESAPAGPLTRPPERTGTRASQSGLTAHIVSTAARWLYQGRRVDMQGLADELGVSRVTLFIGIVGFVDRGKGVVEMIYGIAPRWRGRGLASRAVRLAARWAATLPGVKTTELRIDQDMIECQHVAVNAGFVVAGTGP